MKSMIDPVPKVSKDNRGQPLAFLAGSKGNFGFAQNARAVSCEGLPPEEPPQGKRPRRQ